MEKEKQYQGKAIYNIENNRLRKSSEKGDRKGGKVLLDSGSSVTLFNTEYNEVMTNQEKSKIRCRAANGGDLEMDRQGVMQLEIPMKNGKENTTLEIPAHTVEGLATNLLSFDELYRGGKWELLLRQEERGGPIMKNHESNTEIPLAFDDEGAGGFWLHYEVEKNKNKNGSEQMNKNEANSITPETNPVDDIIHVNVRVDDREQDEKNYFHGVKRGLRTNKKKLRWTDFHSKHGHIGYSEGCEVCKQKKGNMRRIYRDPDGNPKERRPGYSWYLDCVTWSHKSLQGSRYTCVLRDVATGVFKSLHCTYRTDFSILFKRWVKEIRNDPRMRGEDSYQLVSEVITDCDSVWREDNAEFQRLAREELGIIFNYYPPERHEGGSERTIGIYEETVRALLLEQNLPPTWWQLCGDSAEFLLNRFPLQAKSQGRNPEGDYSRPLEELSRGRYSRRQIDRELSYYISPGTLALVHDNGVKGSDLSPKSRYGVAIGMYHEMVIFKDPWHGKIFRSKSYSIIQLQSRVNYFQFLGIPLPDAGTIIPQTEIYHKSLPREIAGLPIPRLWDPRAEIKVQIKGEEEQESKEIQDINKSNEDYIGRHVMKQFGRHGKFRGTVLGLDYDNSGTPMWEIRYEDGDREDVNHGELLGIMIPEGECMEEQAAKEASQEYIYSQPGESFHEAIKRIGVPGEQARLYWELLKEEQPEVEEELENPFKRGRKPKLKHKTRIRDLTKKSTWKQKLNEFWTRNCIINGRDIDHASNVVECKLSWRRRLEKVKIPTPKNPRPEIKGKDGTEHGVYYSSIATGRIIPPNKVQDAIDREDLHIWVEAWDKEMESLGKFGAITHDHDESALERHGITTRAVPTRMISDAKYRDGIFEKAKGRCVIQGFRMSPGIHYDPNTFTPSPNQFTSKALCSIAAGNNFEIASWDISLAYTWGERDKPIALRYPQGFKRYDKEGKELYMIAWRQLYGDPGASRGWTKTRDKEILRMYNDGKEWTARKCRSDPCLYVITYWKGGQIPAGIQHKPKLVPQDDELQLPDISYPTVEQIEKMGGITSYMSIHVDDCDAYGPRKDILAKIREVMKKTWPLKEVGEDFMLGIKRIRERSENGVTKIRLSQTAQVRKLVDTYRSYLPNRSPGNPFPTKMKINKGDAGSKEDADYYLRQGYRSICGGLLWLARGVYVECLYGVSQLTSLMEAPSKKSWEAAMHMLAYLDRNAEREVVFRSDGNDTPTAFADAGFTPCNHTGRSQYGITIMLNGGVIIAVSKRLHHVGLSTSHVELMAVNIAGRHLMWLRNIMIEMGMKPKYKMPIYGDNRTANINAREDIISEKNKYIYLAYHYIKEIDGYIVVRDIGTKENLADIHTKALEPGQLRKMEELTKGIGKQLWQDDNEKIEATG